MEAVAPQRRACVEPWIVFLAIRWRMRLDEGAPPLWVNDTRTWTQIHASPFLDSSRTPALARAFLVPGYSLQRAKFGEYVVHIPAGHFVRIY